MQPSGVVPPPMLTGQPQQLSQYNQPPQPQQWIAMMPSQQQQASQHQLYQPHGPHPPPPHVWAQQASQVGQGGVPSPQQQSQHQPPYGSAVPTNTTSPNENRSLWIGDLQYWMDENYLMSCFFHTGELVGAKVIRNKKTGQSEGYGFLEFRTRAAAESILQAYNGTLMPNVEQYFRMNWAGSDDTPDYTIFVGDLASDVTDYTLQETFKGHYPSVKGAKIVIDRNTGRSKGYGFVRFGDESEQLHAMSEMNGVLCSTRPMRIGPAATKKPSTDQQYQIDPQGNQGEGDPNNTTIFLGALDSSVTDEVLRQVFGQYGDLVHVKIPVGKRCGFVQFASRACAEQALANLNGTQLGGQNIRLSWGRNTSNKQAQTDQGQWNGACYGYPQGYESYGYAQPAPDPNMYYGGYPGYANYQQPQQ